MDEAFDLPLSPDCLGRLEPLPLGDVVVMSCPLCGFEGESFQAEIRPYPEIDESLPEIR